MLTARRIMLPCVLAFLLALPCGVRGSDEYLRAVKPLLKDRCFACHGALKQEAGLRLDTVAGMLRGGSSGPAVIAGKASSSELLRRVSSADPSVRMPPEGRSLTAEEIAAISSWLQSGAAAPANEMAEADPLLHWAFRPPVRSALPVDSPLSSQSGAIDAFVSDSLSKANIQPVPRADKATLLRRAWLDLVGVPPEPADLRRFLADESPDAFAKVVDQLLEDPRYGQRWARHWMDVWRYSDWYGRRHVPDVWNSAPQIWRWRDWIVNSLNADHGYDRMLQEMLAADEISPEDDQAAAATGYLIRNWYALNPNDWMRNIVEHTGKAFLGLTFNCAHCHDHKYDPIAQTDYFKLRAYFEPISIRQDRVPGEADPGPFQEYDYGKLRIIQRLGMVRIYDKSPAAPTWFYTGGDERNRDRERGSVPPGLPSFLTDNASPQLNTVALPTSAWYPGLRPTLIESIRSELMAAIAGAAGPPEPSAAARLAAARSKLAAFDARVAAETAKFAAAPPNDLSRLAVAANQLERLAALHTAEADFSSAEIALATAESLASDSPDRAQQLEVAGKALTAARSAVANAQTALAAPAAETYTPLGPEYPRTSTGRRRALALSITSRNNPLTARVAVNHIWLRHFHAPLVATVADFGRNGSPPTHPELLDWLAVEFMESGWSMKHLHRLILNSNAWQRSGAVSNSSAAVAEDPENRLLWRSNPGRMEAEVVRDSLLSVAGLLDLTPGGQELENSEALTTWRRSLYYAVYPEQGGRNELGELFDAPDPLDCYRRTASIVPQQALALTNSDLVHKVSTQVANRIPDCAGNVVQSAAGTAPSLNVSPAGSIAADTYIYTAFELILSRPPSASEISLCLEFLKPEDTLENRQSLVRALLNHNDFVTIR